MIEYLGKEVEVHVDRPLGSIHPKHKDLIYPVNYGYIPGTIAGDGEEIDAYILGEYVPLTHYTGKVIAVIKRKDDVEDKLVVGKELDQFTIKQIEALVAFTERFFDHEVIAYDLSKELIRPSAKGLIRWEDKILVLDEKEDHYFRLLGGGIDFYEKAIDALHREFKEELGTEIVHAEYIDVVENIFDFKETPLHELCMLYDVKLPDQYYEDKEFIVTGDVIHVKARWVPVNDFKTGAKTLLPPQLLDYL